MISQSEARALARELADAASGDGAAAWFAGSQTLELLDGGSWLLVDQVARTFSYADDAPVSGVRGWLGTSLREPSGFVAVVTSFHVDGRFRERAVQAMGTVPSALALPALAVRLLDHVPEVRTRAWEVLRPLLRSETAESLLDVLLAGANRQHAPEALNRVTAALLDIAPADALIARLTASAQRRVRRWALELGHDQGALATGLLIAAAQSDPDQWIQARCAEWLMEVPDPGLLAALLDARSVEARLVALARAPEDGLSDDALAALLVDRAPRVRAQARWRAQRRAWDVAEFYRLRLIDENTAPRVVVACLEGLALTGNENDLEAAVGGLRHASARVRAAAIGAVDGRATRGHAVELLAPMLLDPSARVSATAAHLLARRSAPPSTAEPAWASGQSSSRRAAWRLSRAAGSWHRVEADLRVAADPDPALSDLGRTGIRNWLEVSAASTWEPLSEAQRTRIAELLIAANLGQHAQRVMAFHAGIKLTAEEEEPRRADELLESPPARRRSWLRLLRGS